MLSKAATLRVLVADDSTPVRERMVSLLNELACVAETIEATDVPSTIESVRRLVPHVVILDIGMPGGSGLDVLEIIRKERIPTLVAVVTNYSDPEYDAKARQAGAAAFFDKSREFLQVIAFVHDLAAAGVRRKPDARFYRSAPN